MLLPDFLKVTLTSLMFVFMSSNASAEPLVDQPAPTFYGVTSDGGTVNLSALKGKTLVLEWTNHECPFVKKHYESGNIPQLQKEAAAKGVVWLQIISSAKDKQGYVDGPTAIKLNESRGAKPAYTILDPEGKIGQLYGAQTSPHLFIINPQGILVYKGGIDSIASAKQEDIDKATNYVRETLAALENGKKVPNPITKPYGCSIKYAS
jgi:peroxiredoxin